MRIAIYPFNAECMAFSEFKDLLDSEYCFSEAASPRSWGFAGMDIETVDGPEKIKKSPKEFTKANDMLVIPDFTIEPSAAKSLINEIVNYIPSVKNVFCCACFEDIQLNEIKEACARSNTEFINVLDFGAAEKEFAYYETPEKRYAFTDNKSVFKVYKEVTNCDIPICAVSGEWETTGKFNIELKLLRNLRDQGYNVSMVGSNFFSSFFGVNRFPDFMFSGAISETEKPHVFNRYLNRIVVNEDPDILIVGVPGAMERYNDYETNRFGILPFITFQAIRPDYLILTTVYREKSKSLLEELINKCKYRYGVKPDTIHLSNALLEPSELYTEGMEIDYENMDRVNSVITNEYADTDGFVVNLLADGCDKIVTERLIRKLGGISVGANE
ncbi:MAG: TIGR04066 family peptide maturation system protein [Ruminococcus flavefaciens]|nr:TIGR04066 family peptide maturation system protein [Ruminococcus flavefaciens]